jgi:hypothetical protein
MTRVLNFFLKELALFWVELWVGPSESLGHFPQVEGVLVEHTVNHDHVSQAHET